MIHVAGIGGDVDAKGREAPSADSLTCRSHVWVKAT